MATELGQAYVQIMPSAKGIKNSIGKQLEPESASAGKTSGNTIASNIKKVILAAGIGKAITGAINLGGELEQNLGGTEAVFGDFADKIQKSADTAYKNMGLSASDYMGTANKMGSLFQGSGIDQQKALGMTSEAMQRAADVASVMGVDTSMAMDSIAGAAKGNFTMMDNLGVAMNATSLQAYALEKGVNFDWKTATQAEKTELAMKMFMDRTSQYQGNFAKESEETFSGSLGAMQSSFKDVLAQLANGGDWSAALGGFTTSIVTFSTNLFPMISGILTDLPAIITTILAEAGPSLIAGGMQMLTDILTGWGEQMPQLMTKGLEAITAIVTGITENLPALLEGAVVLITGLADGITQSIPILVEQIPIIIESLVTTLTEHLPDIIMAGVMLFTSLVQAMPQIIPVLVQAMPLIIDSLITMLTTLLPQIIKAGIDLFTSLIEALPQIITEIVAVLPTIIDSIVSASNELIPLIIDAGVQLLTALVDNLPVIIDTIIEVLPTIIDSIITATLENIPLIVDAGLQLFTALVEALPEIILEIVAALPEIIDSICTTFIENIPLIVEAGVTVFTGLIGALPEIITNIVGAVPEIISGLVKAFTGSIGSLIDVGKDLIGGLGKGIKDSVGGVINKAKDVGGQIVGGVKKFFGINSPSRVFAEIGSGLDEGLANGIGDNIKPVTKAMDKVSELTARSFESDIAFNAPGNMKSLTSSINSGIRTEVEFGGRQQSTEARMLNVLERYLPMLADGKNILLDGDKLVGGVYDRIDEMVAFKQRENELAYGG